MSREHVALLRESIASFNETGVIPRDVLHPDVVWRNYETAPEQPPAGLAGVDWWEGIMREAFEWIRMDVHEYIDLGDRIVTVATMRGRGLGSGVEVEQPLANVWTFQDARLARVDSFFERGDALASAESL